MTNNFLMEAVRPFTVDIEKQKTPFVRHGMDLHAHNLFEIYVHLEGALSFVVERKRRSMRQGDVAIIRPGEYHHSLYEGEGEQVYYSIHFSTEENQELFSLFLDKEKGGGSFIRPSKGRAKKIFDLCEKMIALNDNCIAAHAIFFQILNILQEESWEEISPGYNNTIPKILKDILKYCDENFSSIYNVAELAKRFHISIAMLERYFKKHLSQTPKQYLNTQKLSYACTLLRRGYSVTEACFECGFEDYGHFITSFKKHYHITPLKYKKELMQRDA